MKKDELKEQLKELLTLSTDAGRASEIVTAIEEDYTKLTADYETATKTLVTSREDNEKLRKANLDLFLKVGTPKTPDDETGIEKKPKNEPETNTEMKFEDLFNEKGELK